MKSIKLQVALILGCICWLLPASAESAGWPQSMTIGTASPGGVYLPYGRFLAKLWTEQLGIPVDAVATQGPVHNVKLLDVGGAQVAFVTMGIALQAWNGVDAWAEGKRYRDLRALF